MLLYSRRWLCALSGSVRGRISELMLSKGASLCAVHSRFYEPPLLRAAHDIISRRLHHCSSTGSEARSRGGLAFLCGKGNTPAIKGLGALGERGVLCAPTAHQTNGPIGASPKTE
jgi:hypothetical protein